MNITLNNYEEYFLLLADNELGPAEETLVKEFAARHPHLQEELDILFNCRLDAADMPAFPKETLLRPTIWDLENPAPVHTQMLSLLDNELPITEAEQLKQQIAVNPVLKAEWNTLQKTILPVEAVAYPEKTELYRQHKIRPLVWMRWAAAAAVVGLTWMLWPSKINTSLSTGLVAIFPTVDQSTQAPRQPDRTGTKDTNTEKQKVDNSIATTPAIVEQNSTDIKQVENKTQEKMNTPVVAKKAVKKEDKQVVPKEESISPLPEELAVIEPDIAILDNNSLAATRLKEENKTVQTAQFVPKNNILPSEGLQNTVVINANEPEEENYVHIAGAKFNKQKVRGLFRGITRSVTRTFSKSKIQPAETAYTNRNL
jgi:hypothetical protein